MMLAATVATAAPDVAGVWQHATGTTWQFVRRFPLDVDEYRPPTGWLFVTVPTLPEPTSETMEYRTEWSRQGWQLKLRSAFSPDKRLGWQRWVMYWTYELVGDELVLRAEGDELRWRRVK